MSGPGPNALDDFLSSGALPDTRTQLDAFLDGGDDPAKDPFLSQFKPVKKPTTATAARFGMASDATAAPGGSQPDVDTPSTNPILQGVHRGATALRTDLDAFLSGPDDVNPGNLDVRRQDRADVAALGPGRTLKGVHSIGDALDYAGEKVGEYGTEIAPVIAGGAAAATFGAPAALGAAAAAYLTAVGGLRKKFADMSGVSDTEGTAASFGLGVPIAALQAIVPGASVEDALMGDLLDGAGIGLMDVAKRTGVAAAKSAAVGAGAAGTAAELSEQAPRAIAGQHVSIGDALDTFLQGAGPGAVVGGILGAGGHAIAEGRQYLGRTFDAAGRATPPPPAAEPEYSVDEEPRPQLPPSGTGNGAQPRPANPRPAMSADDSPTNMEAANRAAPAPGTVVTRTEPGANGVAETTTGIVQHTATGPKVVLQRIDSALHQQVVGGTEDFDPQQWNVDQATPPQPAAVAPQEAPKPTTATAPFVAHTDTPAPTVLDSFLTPENTPAPSQSVSREALTTPDSQQSDYGVADMLAPDEAGPLPVAGEVARLRHENRGLQRQLYTSDLTGLNNRRAFEAHRSNLADREEEGQQDYVAIDMAGLKARNDAQDHAAGNQQIKAAGAAMQQAARNLNIDPRNLYHLSGDEFAAIVPKGQGAGLLAHAQREYGQQPIPGTALANRLDGVVGHDWQDADAKLSAYKAARPAAQQTRPTERVAAPTTTEETGNAASTEGNGEELDRLNERQGTSAEGREDVSGGAAAARGVGDGDGSGAVRPERGSAGDRERNAAAGGERGAAGEGPVLQGERHAEVVPEPRPLRKRGALAKEQEQAATEEMVAQVKEARKAQSETLRMYHKGVVGGSGKRWFSSDRQYASDYRSVPGAKLQHVDVPRSWADEHLDPGGELDQGSARGFTLNHEFDPETEGFGARQVTEPASATESPLELKYLSFTSDKALGYRVTSADGAVDDHYSLFPNGRLTDATGKTVADKPLAGRITAAIREDLPKQEGVSEEKLAQYGAAPRTTTTSVVKAGSSPAIERNATPSRAEADAATDGQRAPAVMDDAGVVHVAPEGAGRLSHAEVIADAQRTKAATFDRYDAGGTLRGWLDSQGKYMSAKDVGDALTRPVEETNHTVALNSSTEPMARATAVLTKHLERHHREHGMLYTWPVSMAAEKAASFLEAAMRGQMSVDGVAFKAAARELGFKSTIKNWKAYLAGTLPGAQVPSAEAANGERDSAPELLGQDLFAESPAERPDAVRGAERGRESRGNRGRDRIGSPAEVQRDGTDAGESGRAAPGRPGEEGQLDADDHERGQGSGVQGVRGDAAGGSAELAEHPELVVARDFNLHEVEGLGVGGPKKKLADNMAALRLLRDLAADHRLPNAAEQDVLARYAGWGALSKVFESTSAAAAPTQAELKTLLSPDEYAAARRSVLSAYYTPPTVVNAMWQLVQHLGFAGGRALEPSTGTGHFIGMRPAEIRGATRMLGVELDPITARIAGLLYPEQRIVTGGFEELTVPDGSFDLVIGNPPYGDFSVAQKRSELPRKLSIHNYFLAEAIHRLRPGGLLAYVTSAHTLDAKGSEARDYIATLADFLGAIRLPSGAFKGSAGTDVVTDILVLRRRDLGAERAGNAWTQVQDWTSPAGEAMPLNEYFVAQPGQMLGEMQLVSSQRGMVPSLEAPKGYDFADALAGDLARAIAAFPMGVYAPAEQPLPAMPREVRTARTHEATFRVEKGQLQQFIDGEFVNSDIPKPHHIRLVALTQMRDAVNHIFETQLADDPNDEAIAKAITAARKLYDAFVAKYGPINKTTRTVTKRVLKNGEPLVLSTRPNLKYWDEDPEFHRVVGIEKYDAMSGTARPAEILERPILTRDSTPQSYDTAIDALPAVLAESGHVDLPLIAKKTGLSVDDVLEQLGDRVYHNATTGAWEERASYLSGPVKVKLAQARLAAESDPSQARNIVALQGVQPEDLPLSRVRMTLGEHWIPLDVYREFVAHLFEARLSRDWQVVKTVDDWSVEAPSWTRYSAQSITRWGTERVPAVKVVEAALALKTPLVYDKDADGKRLLNTAETEKASEKYQQVRAEFEKWVKADDLRVTALLRQYNDEFNDVVQPVYDGAHLTFPSAVGTWNGQAFQLRPHQRNFVWQYLTNGNAYAAHVVGAGKTFTGAAIAIEAKRLGRARKPMIVVPNHMLYQWEREFLAMYPTAKLLVADADEFAPAARKAFVAKAASQDWDAIVVKQTAFEMIPLSPERQHALALEDLETYREAIMAAREHEGAKAATVKQLEKMLAQKEIALEELLKAKKDVGFHFEEMGVDLLMVDEAHMYKNLFVATTLRDVGDTTGSKRALDLFYKTRYLDTVNPGRFLVMLSGTPVSNSFAELYTIQRYLQRSELVAKGLDRFDDWVKFFAEREQRLERTAAGEYRMKERYTKFRNGVPLWNLLGPRFDVQAQERLQLPRPPIMGGKPTIVVAEPSEALQGYIRNTLAPRAAALKEKRGPSRKGDDNMLVITNDGRHAGLDIRTRVPTAPDDVDSKINLAIGRIHAIWAESTPHRGAQLVFSDLSTPHAGQFSVYEDIRSKLIALGVPKGEIAFAQEYDTDGKKAQLHEDLRQGRKRIVLTSTPLMGAGTNVQNRLVALHRLDVPWRPSDLEQSEGRILRQGNELFNAGIIPGVGIYRYVTRGSYDEQLWTLVLGKGQMIERFYAGGVDEVEDAGETALTASEALAAAADNPLIPRRIGLQQDVRKLEAQQRQHIDEQRAFQRRIAELDKTLIPAAEQRANRMFQDWDRPEMSGDAFTIQLGKKTFTKRADAALALEPLVRDRLKATDNGRVSEGILGTFGGANVTLTVSRAGQHTTIELGLDRAWPWYTRITPDGTGKGWLASLENLHKRIPDQARAADDDLQRLRTQLQSAQGMVGAPFEQAATLQTRREELEAVTAQLKATALTEKDREIQQLAASEDVEDRPGVLTPEAKDVRSDPRAGFLDLGMMLDAWRTRNDERKGRAPLVESTIGTVEARLQAAKGLRAPDVVTRVRQAVTAMKTMTRHYEALNPATDATHAKAYRILLELEYGRKLADARAYDAIGGWVGQLSPAQVDLMTRQLVLADVQRSIEDGLYDEQPAPFGYGLDDAGGDYSKVRALAQLDTDLAEVQSALTNQPAVREALAARKEFVGNLTEALVEQDLLPKSVLRDDRYYHRQVLSAWAEREGAPMGTSTPEARTKKKGFQRARVGGGDFNTRYEQAEYEWVAQAFHQLALKQGLDEIRQMADIQPNLATEARVQNNVHARRKWDAEHEGKDPFAEENQYPGDRFRRTIAMHTQGLYELLEAGGVPYQPAFADLMGSFATEREGWSAAGRSGRFEFSHPDWWRFLTFLATANGPGAREAAGLFKAIAERNAWQEQYLGRQHQTWEDAIPDGYVAWQPVKGNLFFPALTLEEKTLNTLLEKADALKRDDLKAALVLGGRRETWVLPEQLARTMDQLGHKPDPGLLAKAWRSVIGGWKVWQLLNPLRAVKYNLNNQVGDTEAATLFPGISRYVAGAARDVYVYMTKRGHVSDALREDMQRMIGLRVMDGGLTAAEITDVSQLPAFKHLAEADPLHFMQLIGAYWDKARLLTTIRENILRVAAFRYFEAEGNGSVGVSDPGVVKHLEGDRRAAMLSSDLMGDYGAISAGGSWIRERMIPFYSWMEVNMARYIRLFRNLPEEAAGQQGRFWKALGTTALGAAARLAILAAYTALLANAFLLASYLYNTLLHHDAEKQLQQTPQGRGAHIIVGTTADGRVRFIPLNTAFADFLNWLNLGDWLSDVRELTHGTRTLATEMSEAVRGPVTKIVQGWEPVSKTAFELLTGRSLFPDPFKPRPIRDKGQYAAQQFSLGFVYQKITGQPMAPGGVSFVSQTLDPGEAAYYGIRQKAADYMASKGKGSDAPSPREIDNDLFYYRQAVKWGEPELAQKWLGDYYAAGGTPVRARQSLKRAAPMEAVPIKDRAGFLKSLDADDHAMLEEAKRWYAEDLRAPSRAIMPTVTFPHKRTLLGGS